MVVGGGRFRDRGARLQRTRSSTDHASIILSSEVRSCGRSLVICRLAVAGGQELASYAICFGVAGPAIACIYGRANRCVPYWRPEMTKVPPPGAPDVYFSRPEQYFAAASPSLSSLFLFVKEACMAIFSSVSNQ